MLDKNNNKETATQDLTAAARQRNGWFSLIIL
jgi:hypothetical protein